MRTDCSECGIQFFTSQETRDIEGKVLCEFCRKGL